MSHINNTSFERISEEAHGDILSFITSENAMFSDLNLEFSFIDSSLFDFPVAGVCDYVKLTGRFKKTIFNKE